MLGFLVLAAAASAAPDRRRIGEVAVAVMALGMVLLADRRFNLG